MKKTLRHWAVAACGAAAALAISSCAYDPYYGSTTVGGSYSSGYGDGYGYGGTGFSTSFFVGTGDPRWGYDPYTYAYYDYHSHRYYDPYLHGYYPIGYRPPIIIGTPHPYDWHPGVRYIRPPHYVRDRVVINYRDRIGGYRASNYDWAKQVRPVDRVQDRHPSREVRNPISQPRSEIKRTTGPRTYQGGGTRVEQPRQPHTRASQGARLPSYYNTPISRSERRSSEPRTESRRESRGPARNSGPRGDNRQAAPVERGRVEERRGEDRTEAESPRGNRSWRR